MMRSKGLLLGLTALLLVGCSTGAPRAPMGFGKRPANSPETIAGLLRPTDTKSELPADPAPRVTARPVDVPPAAPAESSVVVLSDYSAPGGLAALAAPERARLMTAARTARSVLLYCRGDQMRPTQAGFRALIRRGTRVKRYLVSQGVAAGKIRIFAKSAGDFVADDATAAGRAKNRRVEIHFA